MLLPSWIEILIIDHAHQGECTVHDLYYMVEFAFLEYYYILLPLCNIERTAGFWVSLFILLENSDWNLNKNSSLSADAQSMHSMGLANIVMLSGKWLAWMFI